MRAKLLAELIGTFTILFAGCGAVMVAERFPGSIHGAAIPFIFGLAVAVMIYAVGHISGAHFNPAVTLAFTIARHFPLRQVPAYWAAQLLGAVLAMSLLWASLPVGDLYGQTILHLAPLPSLLWETVLTFFLMFVIVSVATDNRAVGMMAGLAIGGTVAMGSFVGGPLTGAAMNPARALAPMIVAGDFSGLWVFLAGPLIGASLAALLYERIRCEAEAKPAKGCC